jgi:hypothetical protein
MKKLRTKLFIIIGVVVGVFDARSDCMGIERGHDRGERRTEG